MGSNRSHRETVASTRILIIGASTRAAAFSALRAGLQPLCFDLFADTDLQASCPAVAVTSAGYPDNLAEALETAPVGPFMYTGALENAPALLQRIAQKRPFWGNVAQTLAATRDPVFTAHLLRSAGLPAPQLSLHAPLLTDERRWLAKRRDGAGGRGIRFWDAPAAFSPRTYFQEYICGEPVAAIYVGSGAAATLVGVTQQLVGEPWLHADPFAYCGSIGAMHLTDSTRIHFEQIGNALAAGCKLRGLFGVDAILRDGVPYPVEVNPRYTASVEVLEYALEIPALAWHRSAFVDDALESLGTKLSANIHTEIRRTTPQMGTTTIGKAVYFAPQSFVFPECGPWTTDRQPEGAHFSLTSFADIPAAGTPIPVGGPVLTVFVKGITPDNCRMQLQHTARELDRLLCDR